MSDRSDFWNSFKLALILGGWNNSRSIIARRVSGNGDTPNSIPRVSVRPLQGGVARLWFSSQMPSQGKSARS
mgnify:CR=1 FL=1